MGADSQSLSSLSMAESSQSVPNVGSVSLLRYPIRHLINDLLTLFFVFLQRASDLEKEEMISFKHAQKILCKSVSLPPFRVRKCLFQKKFFKY